MCTVPPDETIGNSPASRTAGLGIQIFDPDDERPARGITVAMQFADGTEKQLVTDRNGFALVSGDVPAKALGATLHAKTAAGGTTVSFAPARIGIIHIGINTGQLAFWPFETLRLHIAGGALLPDRPGRGDTSGGHSQHCRVIHGATPADICSTMPADMTQDPKMSEWMVV
ncbi:hypothetical protein [Sphingomonas sp. PB4P5]|uniref:hypothetical protein n=1 Tax=Parasphingomonas puruogangriensis TaxID=3096155 RepID=UPI002FC7CCEE